MIVVGVGGSAITAGVTGAAGPTAGPPGFPPPPPLLPPPLSGVGLGSGSGSGFGPGPGGLAVLAVTLAVPDGLLPSGAVPVAVAL